MTRYLPILCSAAVIVLVAGCGSGDEHAATSSTSTLASSSSVPTNSRGAIEVDLGQPATITDDTGATVLAISGTRLDTDGCTAVHPEVVHAKFVATIRTGAVETPQWLWPSDVYYVDTAGKVAQNLEVSQAVGEDFACDGSVALIDVPPNSTADGSPTLVVPIMSTAIGYHLKTGDVDQRVEWRLPAGWREQIAPQAPAPPAPAPTEAAPAEEPAPAPETTAPEAESGGGIPPGWDKNGDGLIDTDAPIGDDCDNPQCLLGPGGG